MEVSEERLDTTAPMLGQNGARSCYRRSPFSGGDAHVSVHRERVNSPGGSNLPLIAQTSQQGATQ